MSEKLDYSEGTLRTHLERKEALERVMAVVLPPVVELPLNSDEE